MTKYIIRRLLMIIPVLLGAVIIVFTINFFSTTDPAMIKLGLNAKDEVKLAETREEMGLNRPYIVQLGDYVWKLCHGDFGNSYVYSKSVWELLSSRIPNTLKLGIGAMIISICIGIPLGLVAALHQNSAIDYATTTFAVIMNAMPGFLVAVILMLVFALKLGWFPPSGADGWKSFVLPIIAAGIGPITQFDASEFKCKLAGEVKDFDPETVVDKKEARKMARFTLLALGAAAEAIQDSGIDCEAEAEDIGVIVSSGIGGLPTIEEQHARGEEKGMEKVSPYFVPMAIANMAAAQIAIRFGLKGICTCPVTACAGGTNAVGDAFHRIRDGYEPVMVCGGAESCISPLGIGGFTSMKALSTSTDPDAASLPFDARRGGFVMGEGSGVLVLEELEHAKARGAHIYAEVVGYGANCDAYHFTAPAPGGTGAIGCMKLTLKDGGIAPEQIDHINAHGTGTHMNDSCETAAIHAVFGDHAKDIAVVSTKSMTGHLLGGAGGIEAVFTALALRDQFAPPTIHYEQPDPECDLDYVPNVGREMKMEYALSNSLGFGGHNACLAFKKWEG